MNGLKPLARVAVPTAAAALPRRRFRASCSPNGRDTRACSLASDVASRRMRKRRLASAEAAAPEPGRDLSPAPGIGGLSVDLSPVCRCYDQYLRAHHAYST